MASREELLFRCLRCLSDMNDEQLSAAESLLSRRQVLSFSRLVDHSDGRPDERPVVLGTDAGKGSRKRS